MDIRKAYPSAFGWRFYLRLAMLWAGSLKVRPVFRWYDLWLGAFVDTDRKRVYILPLPCVGICVQWGLQNETRF